MTTENLSLDFMKNQLFGDFLPLEGLTDIAINRPGEIHTKIRGKWQRHDAPVTLRQCHAFAKALASWNEDNVDDTSPILSATLGSGERIQAIIPPASSGIRFPSRCANHHSNRKRISPGLMPVFITW